MKKHIISALTLLALAFTACETEIEYKGDEQEPLLVLNCIAEAGSTAYVSVSHSIFFLGSTEQVDMSLKDAVVTLEVNGKSATLAYDQEWDLYVDERILHEGDRLKVSVTHPKFGTVTAEDVVPRKQSMSFKESTLPFTGTANSSLTDELPGVFTYSRTDSVWKVALHIDDPAEETNFYRMNIQVNSVGRITPEGTDIWVLNYGEADYEPDEDGMMTFLNDIYFGLPSSTQFTLGVQDEDLSEFGISMSIGSTYYCGETSFIFTDEYLHGAGSTSDIVFDIWMHTPIWWDSNTNAGWYDQNIHTYNSQWIDGEETSIDLGSPWDYLDNQITFVVTVSLETITPAYYYYLQSSDKFDSSNWTLFSEPVTVYSNVDGGVGILGISSSATTLTLEREFTFHYTESKK